MTLRGVQGKRRSIYELESSLNSLQVPTLIMVGDEDDPCLEPSVFMKKHIPNSGLVVFPRTGHAANLEEPELFNRVTFDFFLAVEGDRWKGREEGSGFGFLTS